MSKKVALFVGNDITAHLIMNEVVKSMMREGHFEPVLFFPDHPSTTRGNLPELKEFSFHDRRLLNDVVYPFINQTPFASAKNLSPTQLAEGFDLQCETVADVNSPEFAARIAADRDIIGGISIRCFQIFKDNIIDTFKNKNAFFLNLHPGLLPEYRGVMSTFRRMFDIATGKADAQDYGCTLHKIDRGIDTGNILQTLSRDLDVNDSGFISNIKLAPLGANVINNALHQITQGYTLRGYPQDSSKGQYFTYPTALEIQQWKKAGLKLVAGQESVSTLVDSFSRANTSHGNTLQLKLEKAIADFNAAKSPPPPRRTRIANDPNSTDGPKAAVG